MKILAIAALLFAVACPGASGEAAARKAGKESFDSACVRCHGEDGNSDSYAGIRKLGGIGKRLTKAQLKERLNASPAPGGRFLVRGSVYTERQLNELVNYVAKL